MMENLKLASKLECYVLRSCNGRTPDCEKIEDKSPDNRPKTRRLEGGGDFPLILFVIALTLVILKSSLCNSRFLRAFRFTPSRQPRQSSLKLNWQMEIHW